MALKKCKKFVYLLLILLVLSGCDYDLVGSESQPEVAAPAVSQLVGEWHMNINMDIGLGFHNYDIFFTYFLNGTGRTVYVYGDWQVGVDFSWSSANGVVTTTVTYGGTSSTGTATYRVSGNTLTMYGDDGSVHTLQRVQ